MIPPRPPIAASLAALLFLIPATTRADSEIKVQGRSTTTGVWSEIEDDDDANDNDSPRGGNGTQFGNVERGTDKVREFRIQNTGNQPLTVTSVVADSSQYEFTNIALPAVIAANDDYIFGIRYTPLVFGTRTLRVVINNDEGPPGSAERRYTFRVEGTGIGPDLDIVGGATQMEQIPDGAGTPPENSPDFRYFALPQAGPAWSRERNFTMFNQGNRALNISNPRITGTGASAFSFSGTNAGINLNAGNLRPFEITFDPDIAGTYDATFLIDTNDLRPGHGTYSFALRGVAPGFPAIAVEGKDRNVGIFNDIDNDETNPRAGNGTGWGTRDVSDIIPLEDHEFRIENVGTDALTVTGITTSNSVVFPINDRPLPFLLQPGQRTSFFVSFEPQSAQDYTATITILSDDFLDSSFNFQVGGTGGGLGGSPPMMVVEGFGGNPSSWSNITHQSTFPVNPTDANATFFNPTIIGQTSIGQFRIRNTGVDSLVISQSGSGSTQAEFQLVGLANATLGSSASTTFEIHFTPTRLGNEFGFVNIANNDPEIGGTFRIRVGGAGIEAPVADGPEALVLGGENFEEKILPGSEEPAEANGTVIGYNGTHQSQFRIFNGGDEELKITRFEIEEGDGQFEISGLDGNTSIPQGGFHTFAIDYTGPNGAENDAQVILETNDPEAESYSFAVVSAEIDEPAPDYPPVITAIDTDAADILLTIDAPPTRTFQIYVSLDLQTWFPIIGQSNQTAGIKRIPGEISHSPTGRRRFYKAE